MHPRNGTPHPSTLEERTQGPRQQECGGPACVPACAGVRVCGCVGVRVCGFAGVRVCGCAGVR
eukprot:9574498-Alexandrium_andersonii.AAC.1